MKFTQYYLNCLSQASYLIGDETTRRAAVVDPRRDIEEYLGDAAATGLSIEYVIETHFHADFLSGHLELAEATGATIVYGPGANTSFTHLAVGDGESISLGEVSLEFRATPGHTPESVSIVVWEHPDDGEPVGVLTGDTLFIGDVGRPDLLAGAGLSPQDMARQLHESLHTQLMTLPDSTKVWPAHGAGSACGKNLSSETVSTIGEQRRTNHALAPMSVEEFVEMVTAGQSAAPEHFARNAVLNRGRHDLLDSHAVPKELGIDELIALRDEGATVLDTRPAEIFARGHVTGSVNVGLGGRFAEYAAAVVDGADDIVLVCEPGNATEARVRLGRVGIDGVVGALSRPSEAFPERPEEISVASRLSVAELSERLGSVPDLLTLDVRSPTERSGGVIDGAQGIPLFELRRRVGEVGLDRPVVVYCAGGYRSSIAASLLRQRGGIDVSDLVGGYNAWLAREDNSASI